jgi:hypothetical protein
MAWSLRSRRVLVVRRVAVHAKDVRVAAVIVIAGVAGAADPADPVVAPAVVREVTVVAILAAAVVDAEEGKIG